MPFAASLLLGSFRHPHFPSHRPQINELVKRTRYVKVHALLIGHIKNQMPSMFGKARCVLRWRKRPLLFLVLFCGPALCASHLLSPPSAIQ